MFGEYGFYINSNFAGIITNDQLFFKTLQKQSKIQPFIGAKNFKVAPIEILEDQSNLYNFYKKYIKVDV